MQESIILHSDFGRALLYFFYFFASKKKCSPFCIFSAIPNSEISTEFTISPEKIPFFVSFEVATTVQKTVFPHHDYSLAACVGIADRRVPITRAVFSVTTTSC